MTISEGYGWCFDEDTRDLLLRIRGTIGELAPLAVSGESLIGLGEIWNAIDAILNDQAVDVSICLSVGFRHADKDGYQEGLFLCLQVDGDGLVLDELNTMYSPEEGSDRYSVKHGAQTFDRTLHPAEVSEWLSKLNAVKSSGAAELQMYRNHV